MPLKYIKAYAYMSIIKPAELLRQLRAKGCADGSDTAVINYTMYIYAFSRAGLCAALKQYSNEAAISEVLRYTDAHHLDMLSLFFSRSDIRPDMAQNMLETARSMIGSISAEFEQLISGSGADTAAAPALHRLVALMDIPENAVNKCAAAELIQAMRGVLEYTFDDCQAMELL